MYGYQQDCARAAAERGEVQDLEKRLAHIYAAIEGGEDASDLTAPRVRQLITTGEVKRPAVLLGAAPSQALLGAAAGARCDLAALAQSAFSGGALAPAPPLALARMPAAPPVYNRAIGVDPAERAPKLSASQAAEASGVAITATAFRDLTLPD